MLEVFQQGYRGLYLITAESINVLVQLKKTVTLLLTSGSGGCIVKFW